MGGKSGGKRKRGVSDSGENSDVLLCCCAVV